MHRFYHRHSGDVLHRRNDECHISNPIPRARPRHVVRPRPHMHGHLLFSYWYWRSNAAGFPASSRCPSPFFWVNFPSLSIFCISPFGIFTASMNRLQRLSGLACLFLLLGNPSSSFVARLGWIRAPGASPYSCTVEIPAKTSVGKTPATSEPIFRPDAGDFSLRRSRVPVFMYAGRFGPVD